MKTKTPPQPTAILITHHEDKRMIEFKAELFYDGKLVETAFPKNCGFSAFNFALPTYYKGLADYRTDRKKHPDFDFELWCYKRGGHEHRDKPLNIKEGEL